MSWRSCELMGLRVYGVVKLDVGKGVNLQVDGDVSL